MKKHLWNIVVINSLLMLCLSSQLNAQDFQWAASFGHPDSLNGATGSTGISVDAAGNVYSTGYYINTVDFDPSAGTYNLISTGSFTNAYISKLDANGNFIWAKSLGSEGQLLIGSITVDAAGSVYLFGGFEGTADFNPGTGVFNMTGTPSIGGLFSTVFIAKLDMNGDFVWAKSVVTSGNFNYFEDCAISVDLFGNVFTSFGFKGTADFDPGTNIFNISAASVSGTLFSNLCILKLDMNGAFIWAKSVAGTNNVQVASLVTDTSGNSYTAASFSGTGDFDPGSGNFNITSTGGSALNSFVYKLDANGDFVWAKAFLGSFSNCSSLALDASNNLYTSGNFSGTVDFDPSATVANLTSNNLNIFIAKISPTGNLIWAKNINAVNQIMNIDSFGNLYLFGEFYNTVDFDPGVNEFNLSPPAGAASGFACKLNSSGNLVWAKSFNDVYGFDNIIGVSVSSLGMVNVTGLYQNTIDFDLSQSVFNLTPGYVDAFVVQLKSCSNSSSSVNTTACETYTSPSGNYTWTTSGTYYDTIPNSSACDSIITINLTILNKPTFSFTTNDMVASFSLLSSDCNSFVWDFGNGNTSSINPNPIVTYATAGTYGVCLQCNGQPSSCVQCVNISVPSNTSGTTGVDNIQKEKELTIYPNPSTDVIIIEAEANYLNSNYDFLNSIGQKVLSGQLVDKKNTIDIRHLPEGVYFVRIRTTENHFFKLIKN